MAQHPDFARIEEIFAQAIELPVHEQDLFLLSQAGEDSAVLDQVRQLLDARRQQGRFLLEPVVDFRGQTFGSYRAGEEIGRGGMSIVYHAQRIDGGFDKQVAIKVLLSNDSSSLRTSEIQILASLNHPNIVQLHDAGSTELGFRYLILEFIDGVRCLDYRKDAPESTRLSLFLQVCAAVQAAHQSLIIHRDLKPDNILITPEGTVKVLDFGVAKALRTDGSQTSSTYAFTVDYASPQQLLGRPASTTDDVYSLGVLLHEWLSGQLPRKLSGLEMGEILRRVSSEDVQITHLRGDLAAIVLKALSTDPAHRYQTVAALARDVERYLAGDPVEAHAPSWGYQTRKLLYKHRYLASASFAVFALLSFAALFSWRQARLAEHRFNQARSLSKAVLFELHDAIMPLNDSLKARKLLVDRSMQYLEQLAKDSGQRPDLLADTASGYLRLAEIQGKDFEKASLGNSADALRLAELALQYATRLNQLPSPSQDDRLLRIRSLLFVTEALKTTGKFPEAIQSSESAVRQISDLTNLYPGDRQLQSTLGSALLNSADLFASESDLTISNRYADKAVDIYRNLAKTNPSDVHTKILLTRALDFRIANWFQADQFEQALALNQEILQIATDGYNTSPNIFLATYAKALGQHGTILGQLKRYEEAVPLLKRQLELRRKMLAANPSDAVTAARVAATLDRIGFQYQNAKSYNEAATWGAESLAMIRPLYEKNPSNIELALEYLYALNDLSVTHRMLKNLPQSCSLATTAMTIVARHPNLKRISAHSVEKASKLSNLCQAPR